MAGSVTLTERAQTALADLVARANGRSPERMVELALEVLVAHDVPWPPYEGVAS